MKREEIANKLTFLLVQMRELLPADILEALRRASDIVLDSEETLDERKDKK